MPRSSVLSIRLASPVDSPAVQAIIRCQVGHEPLLGGPDTFRHDPYGFALVAESDRTIVGVCLGTTMKPGPMARMLRSGLPDVLHARRIGLLDTVAVHPDHTGRGLGTHLTQAAREQLRRQRAGVWAAVARQTPHGVTMGAFLERVGLEPFAEVPGFWSVGENAPAGCPACGGAACRCSAVMYAGAI